MGEEAAGGGVVGMLRLERQLDCAAIGRLADGARFAPPPLSADEEARLDAADLAGAPPWVAGDYPEWLHPYLPPVLGEERAAQGAALARPAPPHPRLNTLLSHRDAAAAPPAHLHP